jgi:hypothetical protein
MSRTQTKRFPAGTPIVVALRKKLLTDHANQPKTYTVIYEGPERRKGRRTLRLNRYRKLNEQWVAEAKIPTLLGDDYAAMLETASAIEKIIASRGQKEKVYQRGEMIRAGIKFILERTNTFVETIRADGKRMTGIFIGKIVNPSNGSIMRFMYCPSKHAIFWTSTRRAAMSERGEQKIILRKPKQQNWKNN